MRHLGVSQLSNVSQTGQWAYFTVVHESSGTATIYKNGTSIISGAVHTSNDVNRTSNYIGRSNSGSNRYFDAQFDEFRLSSTARSADWIATEYANQNSPSTFFTISAPEDRRVAISSAIINIQGDNIIITFSENITYSVIPTTDFTLNGTSTTIDSITSNSSSITLNLSGNLLSNETITISYTKTSGEINSTQNTDITLENFVNQHVNNNVPKTLPVITSAATNNLGNIITLTFDETIILSNPVPSDFAFNTTYSINITGFTKTSNNIVDMATTSILTNETIGMNYSKSVTSNGITDTNGTHLADFVNIVVANNIPQTPPVITSASTNLLGSVITLTFNESVTLNNPSPSDFTFNKTGFTVSGFNSTSSNVIDLSINGIIPSGQNFTLSYNNTGGTSTTINDQNGTALAFVNGSLVHNLILPYLEFTSVNTSTSGDSIILTFDNNITLTGVSESNFTITTNGTTTIPSSITTIANTLVLNLNNNILFNQTTLLSYVQGSGVINDTVPLVVGSFSLLPVNNNVLADIFSVHSIYTNKLGDSILLFLSHNLVSFNFITTDFTLNETSIGIVSVTASDDTITLTLNSTIDLGQSVSLSFSAASSTTLNYQNTALSSFQDVSVINDVFSDLLQSDWNTRQKITINSNQITTTLQNFTLLVSISDSALSNSSVLPNGADIIFTSSDGFTILRHEIESFTNNITTGTLVAWVRLPTLSSTGDTILYMYYNVSTASPIPYPDVWDSDYEIIYHMDQSTFGAQSTLDSSGNDCHATPRSTISTPFESNDLVSAQIGNGLNFDGVDDINGDYLDLPDLASSLFFNTDFTISAWANIDALKRWARIVDFGNGDRRDNILFSTYASTANLTYNMLQGATTQSIISNSVLQTGQWAYFTVVHESSGTATIYKNGASITSGAVHTSLNESRASNYIGKSNLANDQYFDGKFDEFRLSSTARSADWIATEYANQNSPSTFFTISAPEDRSVVITSAITNTQGDNIIITFNENIIYSVIPTTDFTLTGTSATIDSITSNSSSITLNLSRNLLANEIITISYTKTSGEINSTQNTDITLENFVNQPVINNILDITPPVITLNGNNTVYVELDSSYSEQNATTDDNSPVTLLVVTL
ncbi:MAG: DUF2341 domain-containing protein [Candidatus Nitrosoabyssus spongiisocia]|nr:MAG: DUF2341 domain-containing protein [Nitrosopumilaceae archaeon AB1(1)]